MKELKTIYSCSKCGAQASKWSGRCLDCGAWGTMAEQTLRSDSLRPGSGQAAGTINMPAAEVIDLSKKELESLARIKTNISEVDRVLGGGIIPGSLILLSGEPGIGKSTILAQIADAVKGSIYISGEESAGQIKDRFVRLGVDLKNIKFISETNVEKIQTSLKENKPKLVIIDSIQTVYSFDAETEAGSINQIRAATVKFLETAKTENIPIIIAGHVTKDGAIAGPKSLEHIVDTVIYLEIEIKNDYRVLRATKNRFGSINEIGIFEMTGTGFKEIKNPGSIFLDANKDSLSGSVVSAVMEGTRPFLVEIQALVSKTVFGYPQRKASGFDINRLQVLAAVLTKRAKINLTTQDIILNVVGGLKVNDPSLDLAVCAAIVSSLLNQTIEKDMVIFGEVGLGGEVRNIAKLKERLEEAKKLGFKKAIIPVSEIGVQGMELKKVKSIGEIVGMF